MPSFDDVTKIGRPGDKSAVSGAESFGNALYSSLVTSPIADVKSLFAEDDSAQRVIAQSSAEAFRENPSEGASGFLGQVVGGIAPTAAAIVGGIAFPPAAPALMAATLAYYGTRGAGQGRRKAFEFRAETGKELSGEKEAAIAAGYALSTIVFERIGFKGLQSITNQLGPIALNNIGKTIAAKKASGETAKQILKEVSKVSGGTALVEGLEEGGEQLMTNAIDALYDERGRDIESLVRGIPQSVAAGVLGGALIGNLALGTQASKTLSGIVQEEEFKIQFKEDLHVAAPNLTVDQLDATMSMINANSMYNKKKVSEYLVGVKLEEGKKGVAIIAPRFAADGRALLHVSNSSKVDVANVTNALGKVFRRNLTGEELITAEEISDVEPGGKWVAANENIFGRKFERWMRDGKGSQEENDLYANYRDWFTNVYENVKKGPLAVEVTKEAEQMFEIMTGNYPRYTDEGHVEWLTRISELAHTWTKGFIGALSIQTNIDKVVQGLFDKGINEGPQGAGGRSAAGIAIKNFMSVETEHGVRGYQLLTSFKKAAIKFGGRTPFGLLTQETKDLIEFIENKLPLIYETPSSYKSLSNRNRQFIAPLVKGLNEYFEFYKAEYNKVLGTEEAPFGYVEGMIRRTEEKMDQARDKSDVEEYTRLIAKMKKLKDLKFVHIPYRVWFEKLITKDPFRGNRILSILNKKERSSFSIQQLIDDKIIKPEEVKLSEILSSYSRRAGKDLATIGVVNALQSEGLAKRVETGVKIGKNFVDAPRSSPILAGYKIHREINDWIGDMTRNNGNISIMTKGLSLAKMAAFFNPFFLPMYDIIQGAMLGVLNPISFQKGKDGHIEIHILPGAKAVVNAIKDWNNYTPEWQMARYKGIESKPFNNHLLSHQQMFSDILKTGGSWGQEVGRAFTKFGKDNMLKSAYNLSWRTAWMLDGIVRQMSYRYLTDAKGFAPEEAAQMAALYHGDYASVPAKTRKILNVVFFTPTFKIAMGKLYHTMIRDALVVSKAMVNGDLKNTAESVKVNAGSLVRVVAILGSWHILMKSLGFDDDEFGRRYKREVTLDTGEKKEQVVTWSGPHNLFLKYLSRAKSSLGPERQNPALHFFQANKWEIHPLWRTLSGMLDNESQSGEKIFNVSDGVYTKTLKQTSYFVREIITPIRLLAEEVTREELGIKQERDLLAKEIGKTFEMLSRPFTFSYTRSTKEVRVSRQAQALISSLNEEVSRFAKEGKAIPKENIDRMLGRIDKVLEQLD